LRLRQKLIFKKEAILIEIKFQKVSVTLQGKRLVLVVFGEKRFPKLPSSGEKFILFWLKSFFSLFEKV